MSSLPGSPKYRLSIHTGPTKDRQVFARALKRAKVKVVDTGTAHVTVDVKANSCEDAQMRVAKALQQKGLPRLAKHVWGSSCHRRPAR